MSTRVGVAGAYGRMGQAVVRQVRETAGMAVSGCWERPGCTESAESFESQRVPLSDLNSLVGALDVVIDFTSPEATMKHAVWCAENAVALVVGTTGLSSEDLRGLDEVSKRIPVVQAPNMSVGVNVLCTLVEQAAEMLGESFDLEIVETHHRHKTDAPSGTALRLLDVVQRVRPEGLARFERHGDIGPRGQQEIGVQTLRGGDVVGDHTVFLFGSGERLELTHRATDRSIFAAGAVRAAQWAVQQPAGRYTMRDVLLG